MKLVICQSCNQAFSLTPTPQSCHCGEVAAYKKGRLIYIEGKGKAFSLNTDEFWMSLKRQVIEDSHQSEPCSCKGQEFGGYFYPDKHINIKKSNTPE